MTEPSTEAANAGSDQLAALSARIERVEDELAQHEKQTGAPQTASLAHPVMGSTVIVRRPGKKAVPAIVTSVSDEDGSLEVQLFQGDHGVHTAHKLHEHTSDSVEGWTWT